MAVSPTNTYAQHIPPLSRERPFDPGLDPKMQSIIEYPERLAHRILLRFRNLDKMRANDTADIPSVSR